MSIDSGYVIKEVDGMILLSSEVTPKVKSVSVYTPQPLLLEFFKDNLGDDYAIMEETVLTIIKNVISRRKPVYISKVWLYENDKFNKNTTYNALCFSNKCLIYKDDSVCLVENLKDVKQVFKLNITNLMKAVQEFIPIDMDIMKEVDRWYAMTLSVVHSIV